MACITFISKFNQIGHNRVSLEFPKTREDSSIMYIKVSNNPIKHIITHPSILSNRISIGLVAGRYSTGLGAPFVVNLIGGKLQTVVAITTVISLTALVVLPLLVYLLFKTEFSIPFPNMVIVLGTGLLVPLALGRQQKDTCPK